jgi:proteasome accessory factor C
VRLRYLVPSRDETTERDVDPIRVVNVGDRWYLEGWCHRAKDVRLFRVDRVLDIAVLDVDGTPPRRTARRVGTRGDEQDLFTPSEDDLLVTVELAPGAGWVAEYYPVERVEDLPGGRRRVQLRTASHDWLPRLALRLGGGLVAVDPPEMAARIVALAESALAAYERSDEAPA